MNVPIPAQSATRGHNDDAVKESASANRGGRGWPSESIADQILDPIGRTEPGSPYAGLTTYQAPEVKGTDDPQRVA
jgi:hypothetical protein